MGSHLELESLTPASQCCRKIWPLGNFGCGSKDDAPCLVHCPAFATLLRGIRLEVGWMEGQHLEYQYFPVNQ